MLARPDSILILLLLLAASVLKAQIPQQPNRPQPGVIGRPAAAPRAFVQPAAGGAAQPAGMAGNAGNAGEKQAIKVEDAISEQGVELQFPSTPVSEILLLYEDLTGLKIIRDAKYGETLEVWAKEVRGKAFVEYREPPQ